MRVLVTGGSGFIGTNFIEDLLSQEKEALNIDIKPPVIQSHANLWRECDILDKVKLSEIFHDYKPKHVVHLAARTDTNGRQIDDYRANTDGTQNILEAIHSTPSIERVIITSSQFVHQLKDIPAHDQDYAPHTIYGESKVITEQMTRQAHLSCVWTIIRPTNIWGPWHPRYPKEFWLVLKKGFYFHPGKQCVIRSYGYVGNVAYQMLKILEHPVTDVHGKVFYVGDRPINLLDWVNGFSNELTGKDVMIVPRCMLRFLAKIGDFHSTFPLNSSRFKSMTTDNPAPVGDTFKVLGESPYSLDRGIKETVKWLRENDPNFS